MSVPGTIAGASPGVRWWVAVSDPFAPPFDGTPPVTVGPVRGDRAELDAWAREATMRRPWLRHELRSLAIGPDGLVARGWPGASAADVEARCTAPLPHPAIEPLRRVWSWAPPTATELYEVWIDVVDDVVVWRIEHEKGGDYERRQPISELLSRGMPFVGEPRSLEAPLVAAVKAHRRPDAERDVGLAAQRRLPDTLRALLGSGVGIDDVGVGGRTALGAALALGHDDIALGLLREGASVDLAMRYLLGREGRDTLALEIAVRTKCWRTALELLSRGASPNALVPRAWEIALLQEAPDAVLDAMLARGAVLEASSAVWRARRFHLLAWRNPALAARSPVPIPPRPEPAPRVLMRPGDRAEHERKIAERRQEMAMVRAVAAGDLESIEAGIAMATRPLSDGQSLLHHASLAPPHRQAAIVQRLIAAGTKVDVVDRSGATALAKAVRRNAVAAVHALLASGASPHARDEKCSLVVHAVLSDSPEVLAALLSAGALPTDTDAGGRSARDVAATHARHACLRLLEPAR